MNKDLEALSNLFKYACNHDVDEKHRLGNSKEWKDIIAKSLKELEEYKKLEDKIGCSIHELFAQNVFDNEQIGLAIVENLVKKIKENRKAFKALEIIKKKKVDVWFILISNSVEDYNLNSGYKYPLTQEQYDLLKEVLL